MSSYSPLAIESYAMIGDTHTAALVGINGSIDWLCLPRFDCGACFAALLGDEHNGRWLLAPKGSPRRVTRTYREGTIVLDTEFETDDGLVRLTDCMPPRAEGPVVLRQITGLRGRVRMRMRLVVRFEYGLVVPWARRLDEGLSLVGGPDGLLLRSDVETVGEDLTTVAEFSISEGQSAEFSLAWHRSHEELPQPICVSKAIADTESWWRDWSSRCAYQGRFSDAVLRSLVTLKALTYAPTGGIVAAPTSSLPELLGGERNWDYRYCWIRDATFTLYALLAAGYKQEARAWRDWLLRAVAGQPAQMQILYGPGGERRLAEVELDWLAGYEGSRPVRLGNAATGQFQLDVYGELLNAMHEARAAGVEPQQHAWRLQQNLVQRLETVWDQPDEGIWEVRGGRRQFTHSKVMAWVAADRAAKAIERFGLDGPIERFRQLREAIHRSVCENAWDRHRNTFTQSYDSSALDASLLRIPLVGFLPFNDRRVQGTIEAVSSGLTHEGYLLRYSTAGGDSVDGLSGGEGAFLPCSFWLSDCLALSGRTDEAQTVFQRLLEVRNDVGLLSEEYDPVQNRLVGNFPQAFSHVSLINSAFNLTGQAQPQ